jgi:hypothetical protein
MKRMAVLVLLMLSGCGWRVLSDCTYACQPRPMEKYTDEGCFCERSPLPDGGQ